ncbi:MAG: hypothetical protein ABJK28_12745 [Algibacter sp.]
MRISHLIFFFLLIPYSNYSQNLTKSEKFKISFESPEILESYETESELVLGYDNDNYAVDIEITSIKNASLKPTTDLKFEANQLAKGLGLTNIVNISKAPFIETSYCVKASLIEYNDKIPVYVLYVINNALSIAYEITVYCYNLNTEAGLKIAHSFKLLQ